MKWSAIEVVAELVQKGCWKMHIFKLISFVLGLTLFFSLSVEAMIVDASEAEMAEAYKQLSEVSQTEREVRLHVHSGQLNPKSVRFREDLPVQLDGSINKIRNSKYRYVDPSEAESGWETVEVVERPRRQTIRRTRAKRAKAVRAKSASRLQTQKRSSRIKPVKPSRLQRSLPGKVK